MSITKQPGATYSGQLDYVANSSSTWPARGGYFRYDLHDFGVPTDIRWCFSARTIGLADVPANLQRQRVSRTS